ncbi:BolA family protein [Bordetella genomosp. 9]|uniref:BolA family transcriptional regulator n=1 Tax=Bordetella genomosp. 9 TaxID=1416803 RepID=A0A1W6YY39_9BORD|nr:BolA family protein [Bordetella genomosp. 9]ARP85864.1 BolA family transcriptional regulator [Bordetella genomosp. 9]
MVETAQSAAKPNADLAEVIRQRLQALSPVALEIQDDSHLHAGHAASEGGASHFTVRITSSCFVGLGPVARHRLVYDRLDDLMPFPLHALALETRTP